MDTSVARSIQHAQEAIQVVEGQRSKLEAQLLDPNTAESLHKLIHQRLIAADNRLVTLSNEVLELRRRENLLLQIQLNQTRVTSNDGSQALSSSRTGNSIVTETINGSSSPHRRKEVAEQPRIPPSSKLVEPAVSILQACYSGDANALLHHAERDGRHSSLLQSLASSKPTRLPTGGVWLYALQPTGLEGPAPECLYARPFTDRLVTACIKQRHVALAGSQGAGKTWFQLMYLRALLSGVAAKPRVILRQIADDWYLYIREARVAYKLSAPPSLAQFDQACYIFDSRHKAVTPSPVPKQFLSLILLHEGESPPAICVRLHLPPWTREETLCVVEHMRSKCSTELPSKPEIEAAYTQFGGNLSLLVSPEAVRSQRQVEQQRQLSALRPLDVLQRDAAVGDLGSLVACVNTSLTGDSAFKIRQISFASDAVVSAADSILEQLPTHEVLSLVRKHLDGAVLDRSALLYRRVVGQMLCQGRHIAWEIIPVTMHGRKGACKWRSWRNDVVLEVFQDTPTNVLGKKALENRILRLPPDSVVQFIILPSASRRNSKSYKLDCIVVSWDNEPSVSESDLTRLRERIIGDGSIPIRLVFVTHPERAEACARSKRTSLVTTSHKDMWDNTEVCILKPKAGLHSLLQADSPLAAVQQETQQTKPPRNDSDDFSSSQSESVPVSKAPAPAPIPASQSLLSESSSDTSDGPKHSSPAEQAKDPAAAEATTPDTGSDSSDSDDDDIDMSAPVPDKEVPMVTDEAMQEDASEEEEQEEGVPGNSIQKATSGAQHAVPFPSTQQRAGSSDKPPLDARDGDSSESDAHSSSSSSSSDGSEDDGVKPTPVKTMEYSSFRGKSSCSVNTSLTAWPADLQEKATQSAKRTPSLTRSRRKPQISKDTLRMMYAISSGRSPSAREAASYLLKSTPPRSQKRKRPADSSSDSSDSDSSSAGGPRKTAPVTPHKRSKLLSLRDDAITPAPARRSVPTTLTPAAQPKWKKLSEPVVDTSDSSEPELSPASRQVIPLSQPKPAAREKSSSSSSDSEEGAELSANGGQSNAPESTKTGPDASQNPPDSSPLQPLKASQTVACVREPDKAPEALKAGKEEQGMVESTIRSIMESTPLSTLSRKKIKNRLVEKYGAETAKKYRTFIKTTVEKLVVELQSMHTHSPGDGSDRDTNVVAAKAKSSRKRKASAKGTKKAKSTKTKPSRKQAPRSVVRTPKKRSITVTW